MTSRCNLRSFNFIFANFEVFRKFCNTKNSDVSSFLEIYQETDQNIIASAAKLSSSTNIRSCSSKRWMQRSKAE